MTLKELLDWAAREERLLAHQKINEQKIEEQTKEIEWLRADRDRAWTLHTEEESRRYRLEAEVERLRADKRTSIEINAKLSSKIEAALAIAERLKEMDQPFAGLGVSLVKTLKGGQTSD